MAPWNQFMRARVIWARNTFTKYIGEHPDAVRMERIKDLDSIKNNIMDICWSITLGIEVRINTTSYKCQCKNFANKWIDVIGELGLMIDIPADYKENSGGEVESESDSD